MLESASPSKVPYWIGQGKSALFGLFHAPARQRSARSVAVVVVPPLGYEAICTHRALRDLAERLAERGFFTLRYDHPGSGDSAGEASDQQGIAALLDGVSRAIEAAKRETGANRVALLGLRAGALLALKAAEKRTDVASLVLWALPPSGRSYVRELRALRGFSAAERREPPVLEEVAGFAFSTELLADLQSLDTRRIELAHDTQVLLIPRDDAPPPPLQAYGSCVTAAEVENWPGYADTVRDPHEARLPEIALSGIVGWIEKRNPSCLGETRGLKAHPRGELEPRRSIVETAVSFGPEQRLFGIVTRAEGASATGPCVLWLNAGATHRVGMNRNYVSFARSWAERGVTSLRFDASGLGDSAMPGLDGESVLYAPTMVDDVRSAIDFMELSYGSRSFVLAGLCAGAYAAFHGALADERVTGAIIINPQTFDWKPGDTLAIERRRTYRAANWYRRSALKPESWRKALRGEVDLFRVARVVLDRLSAYAHSRAAALRGAKSSNTLWDAFDALCSRGTQVVLVYSAEDPGLEYLRDELGAALERLQRHPSFALEVIEAADHTFSTLEGQLTLRRCLSSYLSRWPGSTNARAAPAGLDSAAQLTTSF